jgi:hypothetical protein
MLVDDEFGGYYYSQCIGNYHNPLWEHLLTNQYNGMKERFRRRSGIRSGLARFVICVFCFAQVEIVMFSK